MRNKAIIDLNVLRQNALAIKSKLNKGTLFNAVVKADAYGHGGEVVANALNDIVDCYSVAIAEEGVALRQSGINKSILCFTPFSIEDVGLAIRYRLTSTVTNLEQVKLLESEAKRQGVSGVKVQIKYNSGMNRQGVDCLKDLNAIANLISNSENLYLDGVYSHFSAPNKKKSLKFALDKFLLANNLVKGYNNKAISHVSASGGFLQGVQGDMVRIGILLYGYKPFDSEVVDVKPIMKLYSPVIKTRKLKAGQTALYGDKRLKKDSDIYLVRYGYADGLPRLEVGGQFNNRCMDLTAYTEGQVCEHGFSVMEDAQTLAKKYRTISYEILTKCAIRAEKIYLR